MNIYELTGELLELLEMAESGEIDEALTDTLEAVGDEFDDKIEAYCKVIQTLNADAEMLKAEEKRLAEKRGTIEGNVKRMKNAVENAMRAVGKTKAGGKFFSATIRKNGGKAPLIVEADASDMPDEFRSVYYKADNEAIRTALECGRVLGWAKIGERGESLVIK